MFYLDLFYFLTWTSVLGSMLSLPETISNRVLILILKMDVNFPPNLFATVFFNKCAINRLQTLHLYCAVIWGFIDCFNWWSSRVSGTSKGLTVGYSHQNIFPITRLGASIQVTHS